MIKDLNKLKAVDLFEQRNHQFESVPIKNSEVVKALTANIKKISDLRIRLVAMIALQHGLEYNSYNWLKFQHIEELEDDEYLILAENELFRKRVFSLDLNEKQIIMQWHNYINKKYLDAKHIAKRPHYLFGLLVQNESILSQSTIKNELLKLIRKSFYDVGLIPPPNLTRPIVVLAKTHYHQLYKTNKMLDIDDISTLSGYKFDVVKYYELKR